METVKFVHRVSKGSKFNQIYIPQEKVDEFQPGDLVEVRLLKKNIRIYYSKNLSRLSEFKEKLIHEIFNFLAEYTIIKQVFIFGSFLTKKIDYKDIDILILTDSVDEKHDMDANIYDNLIQEFNIKFHVISYNQQRLNNLLKICPLTRSMLYYHVSNKKFEVPKKTSIDEKHIRFLLMMPEDLLETDLDYSEEYYNALRKLCVIESFLTGKEVPPDKIDSILEKLISKRKLELLKRNEFLDKAVLKEVKDIIKDKLNGIDGVINKNNGKK